jgi:DNA-binding NarL/FixJ family response regulator
MPHADAAPVAGGAPAPVRVVVADDHPLFRAGLRAELAADGRFEVVGQAGDGEEALALVRALRPDVLLLDVAMPGRSGLDVAQALADDPQAPRILALSAHAEPAYITGLLAAGAAGFVTKDQHPAVIREAILAVHHGQGRWFVPMPRDPALLSPLTGREHEVLCLMARGLDNAAIASRLGLAENTVRNNISAIYSKLEVHSAREAVAWAWANGFAR